MPTLRFSAESKRDLKQIASYIARDKPVAARQWAAGIREKCRVVAEHPGIGDDRPDLGERIRSTYAGRHVIYFRQVGDAVEIVRVIPGDRDVQTL